MRGLKLIKGGKFEKRPMTKEALDMAMQDLNRKFDALCKERAEMVANGTPPNTALLEVDARWREYLAHKRIMWPWISPSLDGRMVMARLVEVRQILQTRALLNYHLHEREYLRTLAVALVPAVLLTLLCSI